MIALRNLYEVEDNIASLELFTQRFCGRMLELAEDVDEDVAVEAVKLIKELLRSDTVLTRLFASFASRILASKRAVYVRIYQVGRRKCYATTGMS